MIDLGDRWLTATGITIVEPTSKLVNTAIRSGHVDRVRVTELTEQLQEFNNFADVSIEVVSPKDFKKPPTPKTVLPAEYASLDVDVLLSKLVQEDIKRRGHSHKHQCIERAVAELTWLYEHGKIDLIRTLVYVVDVLNEHDYPWGIGRGSSVSSYVLFLIGVHGIDPIAFDLDWHDFMRD